MFRHATPILWMLIGERLRERPGVSSEVNRVILPLASGGLQAPVRSALLDSSLGRRATRVGVVGSLD